MVLVPGNEIVFAFKAVDIIIHNIILPYQS